MKAHAADQLKSYLTHYLPECTDYINLDRREHYRLFELVAAYELDMVLWPSIPQKYIDTLPDNYRRFLVTNKIPKDYGIDGVHLGGDADHVKLDAAMQAKWQAPKTRVKWAATSTFNTLCDTLKISEITMAVSEGVRPHTLSPDHKICNLVISNDRMLEIIQHVLRARPAVASRSLAPAARSPTRPAASVPPMHRWQLDALYCLNESIESKRDTKQDVVANITCGAGKTRLLAEIIKSHRNVAVFVPSVLLMDQIRGEFERWGVKHNIQLVGDSNVYNPKITGIVICTYNSAAKLTGTKFDLIVVDEAHHVHGKYGKYAACIRGLKYRVALHVSATLTKHSDFDYEYYMYEAIRDEIVVDYQIVIPVFDKHGNQQDGLRQLIIDHPEWTRVLAYCNTVDEAKQFTADCCEACIKSETFDGTTPASIRQAIINRFERGEIRILTTVNTLGEGVDIRAADTALFVEPRKSQISVTQILGRVMRRSPGKTLATVILPAIDAPDKVLNNFIKLLSNEDFRLQDARGMRKRINVLQAGRDALNDATMIECDIYTRLGKLIGISEPRWVKSYNLVKEFVDKHGRIPMASCDDRPGTAEVTIKNARRGTDTSYGPITSDIVIKFNSIKGFTWGKGDIPTWRKKFNELKNVLESGNKPPRKLEFWARAQQLAHDEPKFHAQIECQREARSTLVPPTDPHVLNMFREYKLI